MTHKISDEKIKRILLIRLSSIGDVLLASPVAEKVRKRFPTAHITWLVETKAKDVIVGNPFVDEVIVWPRREWNKQARETRDYIQLVRQYCNFIKSIRALCADLSVNMQGDIRSAFLACLSGAKCRIARPNGKEFSSWFANCLVDNTSEKHLMLRNIALLSPLGIGLENAHMYMPLTEQDVSYANKLLSEHCLKIKQFVVFNPATSVAAKCWPTEYYAALADRIIAEYQLPVVFLGAPSDCAMVEDIMSKMGHKAHDFAGKTTLNQLAAVVKSARLFVGGDTGPLHVAAAVGTPTVSIFGPTAPEIAAPIGENHIALSGRSMRETQPFAVFEAARRFLV